MCSQTIYKLPIPSTCDRLWPIADLNDCQTHVRFWRRSRQRLLGVYIGLPALELTAPFVGYEVTALSEKPVASLLIGDQNEFEKHFRFPTIKA